MDSADLRMCRQECAGKDQTIRRLEAEAAAHGAVCRGEHTVDFPLAVCLRCGRRIAVGTTCTHGVEQDQPVTIPPNRAHPERWEDEATG